MDLEDEGWVNIPYEGLLEVHDDGDDKIFSRKYVKSPLKLFKSDYFNTTQKSQNFVDDDEPIDHKGDDVKEMIKLPVLITDSKESSYDLESDDQDPIFQVFFKKENKFVEMKMGSPKSNFQESNSSHIETGPFQYDENCSSDHTINCSSPTKMINEEDIDWEESNKRLNLLKWGLSGIGAFCSLGMVAATICIIILGNGKKHKKQNQKLRIQIYPDNKRIKQVVKKASEAMSAVRGVPLVQAQITYGGYYETQ
ncbi:uncharacterized protein [Rutidosis leptorrhynchoides]|uniref:uncharacterized protein n=1 Tax=Rutidosis leptorrhynchoides TaxID=125765 RepID=UPI003A995A7D